MPRIRYSSHVIDFLDRLMLANAINGGQALAPENWVYMTGRSLYVSANGASLALLKTSPSLLLHGADRVPLIAFPLSSPAQQGLLPAGRHLLHQLGVPCTDLFCYPSSWAPSFIFSLLLHNAALISATRVSLDGIQSAPGRRFTESVTVGRTVWP